MCNQYKKCRRFHPYAFKERPSRAKCQEFIVDGHIYLIMGVNDPSSGTIRPVCWPDDPDEQIGEALCAVVKGWS